MCAALPEKWHLPHPYAYAPAVELGTTELYATVAAPTWSTCFPLFTGVSSWHALHAVASWKARFGVWLCAWHATHFAFAWCVPVGL